MSGLVNASGAPIRGSASVGSNLPNSVADVHRPFPAEWMARLREISPVTELHSWLLPYWYRAGERWVLYDCAPRACLPDDDTLIAPGMSGKELFERLNGLPPREREGWDWCPYVSDVQHEMYRVHQVYARPYWVLQGESGGHQVAFTPWQQNVCIAKHVDPKPPAIGSLPPCPFDERVVRQLQRLNRIHQMDGSLERMRATGTAAGADAATDAHLKEIRDAEMAFLETQLTPLVDAARSVAKRSDARDHLQEVDPGAASAATDALQHYKQTGEFLL